MINFLFSLVLAALVNVYPSLIVRSTFAQPSLKIGNKKEELSHIQKSLFCFFFAVFIVSNDIKIGSC